MNTDQPKPTGELEARITDYLVAGGLFNPEMMEHDKVRDLLMDCRDALTQPKPATYNSELADVMLNEGDYEGLANEVAKPNKPASGKWTKETVREICRGAHGIEQEWQRVAVAHNAAIAAKDQEIASDNLQLAAERSKVQMSLDALEKSWSRERSKHQADDQYMANKEHQLRKQLAAEREKVQTLVDALKNIVEEGHPEQWEVMVANAAMAKLEKK